MAQLKGKSAIVTGSTSGIGMGIAERLAQEGCSIMLNGLGDQDAIMRELDLLQDQYGIAARYHPADLRRPDQIYAMVEAANNAFGGIDILVNNAGIQHVAPVEEFPLEKWDAILAINLSASFHTIRAVLPSLKQKGWGRIINIASKHGLTASPYKSAYVAAKHGVLGLTKTVALEVAEFAITCNAICPGYVHTPLVDKQIEDQARTHGIPADKVIRDILLKNQPTRQFVSIPEIADLTIFLCSASARSINGAALSVDGGWCAQ